ncbi:MAG: type ISP restriction/modification enzyme, partial [Candidatus Melainabacteria bacterium]
NANLLHEKFNVSKKEGWNILKGYDNIKNEKDLNKFIQPISYRPFDNKYVFYEDKLVWRTVRKVMQHFIKGENVGLVFSRQSTDDDWTNIQITNTMIDNRYHFSYKGIPNQAPLYLYNEQSNEQTFLIDKEPERKPNLKEDIVNEIANKLGLKFTAEKLPPTPLERGNSEDQGFSSSLQGGGGGNSFAPIDLLDYIYAVLHSPSYREKYKEFLKVDFPRVPYPDNQERFWKLVEKGSELRELHLLESSKANQYITSYPQDGSNQVEKVEFKDESKVYINSEQYFDNVPKLAWEFYIGGYQPAQKWLKDRKGRELSYEDILHYQKVIVALTETDRLMKEIDDIGIENAEFAISAGGRK